jgi:hypothetical protein
MIAYDQTLYTFELLDSNEPKRKEKNLEEKKREKKDTKKEKYIIKLHVVIAPQLLSHHPQCRPTYML